MIRKKGIYIFAILLICFFISVMIAFFVRKETTKEYKGTLVDIYRQEAVI